MIIRLLLLASFITMAGNANATQRFVLDFSLIQGETKIESGKLVATKKFNTWSKGVKRSYLKLRCHQNTTGKIEKLYSTVDYFDGLTISHQLLAGKVELTVVRNSVQPRLLEIRALSRTECKDMSPVVSTTSETYSFPANDGLSESRPFGENMIFRVVLLALSEQR
ncbi:MAG: hypothetical protein ACN4GM_09120 [Gammaproteobacteria bacterium]